MFRKPDIEHCRGKPCTLFTLKQERSYKKGPYARYTKAREQCTM